MGNAKKPCKFCTMTLAFLLHSSEGGKYSLNFLDVSVEKEGTGFLTSINRKPTLTGQYVRWNSFSPKRRKISLTKNLVHRALIIRSKTKLGPKLDKIQLFIENGYPADVLLSYITKKTSQLCSRKNFWYREVPSIPKTTLYW